MTQPLSTSTAISSKTWAASTVIQHFPAAPTPTAPAHTIFKSSTPTTTSPRQLSASPITATSPLPPPSRPPSPAPSCSSVPVSSAQPEQSAAASANPTTTLQQHQA